VGNFLRAAPLALVVGTRLNEWDLVAHQSLVLYRDALHMCFDSVEPVKDPLRWALFQKARWFLTPIARDTHSEPFLAHSALAFLKAM
jgi:hypothetical protein